MSIEGYTFDCPGEPERPVTEELCRSCGASYPDVFSKTEDMTKAALEIKRLNHDKWVKLPFCVTIEAEAFGASISLNSLYGVPAATQFRYEKVEEINSLPTLDFSQGRLSEVLCSASLLHAQGEKIILNMEGPYTILGQLISSKQIYKGLYRNKDKLSKIVHHIGNELVRYAIQAEKHGVDIISYADPTVAYGLISPKIYYELCGSLTWEILRKIQLATHRIVVHLCNVTSVGFEKSGFCISEKLSFPPSCTYGEALIQVIQQRGIRLIGHGCVQRSFFPVCNGGVFRLVLTENPKPPGA
ncbi:MAG: hypothetical protein IJ056_01230 [Acidaminococcaceae bacterium]|nr:hypothetical protein [Acidaminococcaceae bacterium]MBQ9635822.1 hypothetical protein [Acidaminococcaceae bacterium]MBQ9698729.1 hypothetical protein [Acidaminococcaceae bacterium]MBR1591196.1 hypothetical protein [Acidaminococcaceae bacterium]